MKYGEFKSKLKGLPFFRSNIFAHLTDDVASLRNRITEWIEKGRLIKLKRGMYTLNDDDRKKHFSKFFLANNLYTPSYISLESALSFYGLIPEAVYGITSISSKKTQEFKNTYGRFSYQNIKTSCFDYFISRKDEFGNNFYIAIPEKAIIDFFYLKVMKIENIDSDVFEESYRLQNLEQLDLVKLKEIASKFQKKKLNYLVELFIGYCAMIKLQERQ